MLPVLEEVLSGFGRYRPGAGPSKGETMDTVKPTPIRRTLPIAPPERPSLRCSTLATPPSTCDEAKLPLPPGEGRGEGPPRFIPLAVAIDLGMTPPIGSIRTTEVEVIPAETERPARPVRRHLRLLPQSGG
jgi:hypothetical protein